MQKILCRAYEEWWTRNYVIEGNDVYTFCDGLSVEEIVEEQCRNLVDLHKEVNVNNRNIPKLFTNPKFHKRPYYRFIAVASKAVTKELAVDVNLCLNFLKKVHKAIFNRTGYL